MDPRQHSSGSQDSAEKLDLPPSSLFVPKFTKAREPRPLNRDGTPMNHELTRVPSAADLPPLPLPRLLPAAVTVDGTRLQDVLAAQAGGHRIVGTMSRTLSPPSPAPSPAIDTRSLDSNETRATASSTSFRWTIGTARVSSGTSSASTRRLTRCAAAMPPPTPRARSR